MTELNSSQIKANELAGVDHTPRDFKKIYMSSFYEIIYCLENSIDIEN